MISEVLQAARIQVTVFVNVRPRLLTGTKVSQETGASSQFSSSSVRWRNQVPANAYYVFAKLHGVTSKKIVM
jgi:hypothetical protein